MDFDYRIFLEYQKGQLEKSKKVQKICAIDKVTLRKNKIEYNKNKDTSEKNKNFHQLLHEKIEELKNEEEKSR